MLSTLKLDKVASANYLGEEYDIVIRSEGVEDPGPCVATEQNDSGRDEHEYNVNSEDGLPSRLLVELRAPVFNPIGHDW